MAFDQTNILDRPGESLDHDETDGLISSEKVDGTAVYNRQGERLGSIHHLMVGKRDGRVRYAVMNFGGILGIGERYHPLPWDVLTYDTDMGGYSVDLDKERLEGAPSFERGQEPAYDRVYAERIGGFYGRI
ncbi:PRC-barrel domain-containing protein [Sphingosinicella rhizophila]|uniref:PRC-barrel domain-containing protein n=1 Tax=Sphingosinicella rhizophila TaxID=3050082 RepID=A0ABU3Q6S7_9SPHN|nr:PRC-barrel domain-containing protein [Sphingosinicella sp. GR2756]MDT9599100.1 PRC-barrel domain-containing protein [Sphingosinicella sp. GR2756]